MRGRILMACALAAVAAPAAAQSEWLANEGTGVALEWRHPVFAEEAEDESLLNGAYFLSARFRVPVVGVGAVAELPFGYGKFTEDEGSTSIGDLYLGVEMPLMLIGTLEAGLRLPTTPEADEDNIGGMLTGYLASFTDRYDAFSDAFTPRVGAKLGMAATELIAVEANVGAAYLMYTGDDDVVDIDNDFALDAGVRAFTSLAGLRLGAGFEGVTLLTTEDEEDSFFANFGVLADYSFGMVRPGVTLFLPVAGDEYKEIVDMLFGVHVEIDLPM